MNTKVNRATTFAQDEDQFLYCPVCNRKEYRTTLVGNVCMHSQPPCNGAHCPGILTLSTARNLSIDAIAPFASS